MPRVAASKKSVRPSEQDRPDIARKRALWKKYQAQIDPKRLVFIDETWTNMEPLRGWAPRGQRLNARVPHGYWQTLTFVAALGCDRIDAPGVFDGPINAKSFLAYVTHSPVPTLKPRDMVVMDTLSSAAGARLLFLPAYSLTSTRSSRYSPSSST